MTAQEIRATAELARLLVSDADLERLRGELTAILDYAAQLAEVDVTGVRPTTHAVELTCPLRADVVGRHDSRAEALRNAPASEGPFFVVPAVFAGAAVVPVAAGAEADGTAAVSAGAVVPAAAPAEADGTVAVFAGAAVVPEAALAEADGTAAVFAGAAVVPAAAGAEADGPGDPGAS